MCVGNAQLSDLGTILSIQDANKGTIYVANNDNLCFDAAIFWSRDSESYLEYNVAQVCVKCNDKWRPSVLLLVFM